MFQQILNITHHWRSIYNYISLWYILQDIAYIFWQRCVSFMAHISLITPCWRRVGGWVDCLELVNIIEPCLLLEACSLRSHSPFIVPDTERKVHKYICRCQNKLTTAAIGMLNLYLMSLPLRKKYRSDMFKKSYNEEMTPMTSLAKSR